MLKVVLILEYITVLMLRLCLDVLRLQSSYPPKKKPLREQRLSIIAHRLAQALSFSIKVISSAVIGLLKK